MGGVQVIVFCSVQYKHGKSTPDNRPSLCYNLLMWSLFCLEHVTGLLSLYLWQSSPNRWTNCALFNMFPSHYQPIPLVNNSLLHVSSYKLSFFLAIEKRKSAEGEWVWRKVYRLFDGNQSCTGFQRDLCGGKTLKIITCVYNIFIHLWLVLNTFTKPREITFTYPESRICNKSPLLSLNINTRDLKGTNIAVY